MAKAQRKAQARLDRRRKAYDEAKTTKKHQQHRPGSLNRKRG